MAKRTKYSDDFRREAVRMMADPEIPIYQLAERLGVSESMLYRWRSALEEHGENAFPGKGHQRPEEDELTRLRRENAKLKEERDFLHKAAAYFAQKSP